MATTPMTKPQATRHGLELYYGYSHELAYVIRTPSRAYSGTTETVPFTNGQATVPAVPGATAQQRWNRGERLTRMVQAGYAIYEAGMEPAPSAEPLWAGQDLPEANAFETDFGVAFGPRSGFEARVTAAVDDDDEDDD